MPPPSAVPTPTPITSQAVAPDSTVSPSRNISSPPSAPLSFLSPSGAGSDSSSVLMSVSRGKHKVSAISVLVESNTGSEISRKRVRGPSVATTVQAENAESMKRLSHTVEEISKTLATSGITTNNDIWQHAVMVLNSHQGDFSSVDNFLDLGRFLTSPANKQECSAFCRCRERSRPQTFVGKVP